MLLFIQMSLISAAVYPVDSDIGLVSGALPGSAEEKLLVPFREEFSLQWLDSYVAEAERKTFALFYSDTLLSLLPLENPIVSEFRDGYVNIKDTVSGALVTVYADDEMMITALGIR